MKHEASARAAVLGTIRQRLAGAVATTELPDAAAKPAMLPVVSAKQLAYAQATQDVHSPLQRFQERLDTVGARCWLARDTAEAAEIVAAIVATACGQSVIRSDAPGLATLAPTARPLQDVSRAELLACDIGVTTAQWGIAETGTLVLESGRERHRLLSLLPRVHVAVLPAEQLCDTMGEALRRVAARDHNGIMTNRAITFITGPSRTSDIELTLVIGVHGPQELHVVVLTNSQET